MGASVTGVVFDIRELTIHDGPGLRTTVFLKGCPLHCAWCHNPEGRSPKPEVLHGPNGDRVVGRSYRADELAAVLNRQAPLLADGGVSFSGGEPLMQAAFLEAVLERLEGLHVVLGTSGCASADSFMRVVRRCDLVLFDLKLIDPEAHRRWTGADNQLILNNLKRLADLGVAYLIRTPLVPGVTDTEANLSAIARHVRALPGRPPQVELLQYNRAAGGKYAACGLEWRPDYDETVACRTDLTPFHELHLDARVL
jgi:pyruvate formate lyase activating enzyme